MKGETTMRYDYTFNPARKVWTVWRWYGNTCETVKTFKTEAAAAKYCKLHNGEL